MKYTLVILFAIMAFAKSQIVKDGECKDISKFNNLNKQKILGTWFTIKSNNNDIDASCMKDVLDSWEENTLIGNTYAATNTTGMKTLSCRAELQDQPEGTKFIVQHGSSFFVTAMECIDTDYENYLITAACDEEDDKSETTIFIDTRSKTPSKEVLDKIAASLKQNKLDSVPFNDIPQNC